MTSASGTQRRSSGPTGAGLAFDLSVRIRRPAPEVFALLADIKDAEPLPRRATLRMVKDPLETTQDGCVLHHRETLRPRASAALAACGGYRPTAEAARCRATR